MSLTAADIQEIMRLIEASDFDELILETAGTKLVLRRGAAVAAAPVAVAAPLVAPMVPSAMLKVTVRLVLSTSANGVPVNSRLPAISSLTVKVDGTPVIVGASLTAMTLTVFIAEVVELPMPSLMLMLMVRAFAVGFSEVFL